MATKGMGSIMAAVTMAQQKTALEKGEALACPICGNIMDAGASFFCYGDGKKDPYGKLHPCVETTHEHVKDAFFESYNGYGVAEEWQSLMIAAVVDNTDEANPVILAELRTVRGPGGKTNMSASTTNVAQLVDLPQLVKKFGWTFHDWYPD